MKYTFKDMENPTMYDTAQVIILAGQYSIFNNIVSDKLKNMCKGTIEFSAQESELFSEFSISDTDSSINTSLDFNTFMEVVKVPAVTGKWFCSVDYPMLTKKQKDLFDKYYKRPSKNGVLVIRMPDFSDSKMFIRNRIIGSSAYTHLIQLSFPNRSMLVSIITKLMQERNVGVAQKAAELFVMRMSASYDSYEETLDKICLNRQGTIIGYTEMVEELKGIDNYILDDFLVQLTSPMRSHKIVASRKIYKMEAAMLAEFGARQLVQKLKYKVDDMIDMRMLINKGIVPIKVKYSVPEAKRRMGEEHRLNKLSDFSFRKTSLVACRTSLKDWIFIKLILNSADSKWSDTEYERIVHTLVNRSVFCESRLMNDIGMTDILEQGLYDINSCSYIDRQPTDI